MIIDKIIAVEGLDKTGKSTFCNEFERIYNGLYGINFHNLKKTSFPNPNSPIGKKIRNELESLKPDTENIVNTPNFLSEMSHFWMNELYHNHKLTKESKSNIKNQINPESEMNKTNYLIDRYFISTLAYQAFFNNNKIDLEYIKTALQINKFIKLPTDIIFLDLPNDKIIERTQADNEENDSNDTVDETIINKRREAYIKSLNFLKGNGIRIHSIQDSSLYSTEDLVKILIGEIF